MVEIAKTLREEARTCSQLILWLDCDREGEKIAQEVRDVCVGQNPRLTVLRARFSSFIVP